MSAFRLRFWAISGSIAAAYFVTGKLSLMLASLHPNASPVWPPTGLALAVLLLLGIRYWPAVLLGAFLVNVTTEGTTLPTAAIIAIGNTLEAVTGFLLVTLFAGKGKTFETVRGVMVFSFFAVVLSPVVSASFGLAALTLAGTVTREASSHVWFTWWLGDMVGSITVAPFIVLWVTSAHKECGVAKAWEAVVVFLLILLTGALVFTPLRLPLSYLCLLPILWTSLRFTPRDTSLCIILISIISIAGTLSGWGPFAVSDTNSSLLYLQAFMAVASFIGLILSAAILERRTSERTLEECVHERTKELAAARTHDRANLERFRNVIDHMTVATIALDEHLGVLHTNSAFRHLFHVKEKTGSARTLTDMFSLIRSEFLEPHETIDGLLRVLTDRKKKLEMELVLKNTAIIYCDYIPVFDDGVHRGHVFLFRDRKEF